MSVTILRCDQAIFTSVRTPMGEGYRIIAASRGLRPGERQTITRYSPSHDALCGSTVGNDASVAGIRGFAFYPLPGGRLCVAFSSYAGAEHTGRGGKRIYTHNLIFEKQDFPRCAYNPFTVLRAMIEAQGTSPQLKPPTTLPELELVITESALGVARATLNPTLGPAWWGHVLQTLLDERNLIVNVADSWFEVAEALLIGLPGPMREGISFGAGLRFSVARCHHLSLLHDDNGTTKTRITGLPVEYIDPTAKPEPPAKRSTRITCWNGASAWLSFVERHWAGGDTPKLARRTSKAFTDVGESGRERVGRLYNEIDAIPDTDIAELLSLAARHLSEPERGVEASIAAEFMVAAQRALLERLSGTTWDDASRHWHTLCTIGRQSEEGHLFTQPLIEQALHLANRKHATIAAEAALELTTPHLPLGRPGPSAPLAPAADRHTDLIDSVLERLAEWAEHASDADVEALSHQGTGLEVLVARWRTIRPQCPAVERISRRCHALASSTP